MNLKQGNTSLPAPFTCVFSPDGILLNLLPDLTYESFAYMERTVKEGRTDDEYYCYNRLVYMLNFFN
jgi:hypothetical protein